MANANLKDKIYVYNGEKLTYTALAMRESRLLKAKERCNKNNDCLEFNKLGGDAELKKLESIIHKEQTADYNAKKTAMDAGLENRFINKHEKDRDNSNPTGVGGVPKIHKGSINRKIMSNKEVYNESLSKEISEIRYLIEYMNNNNKKTL